MRFSQHFWALGGYVWLSNMSALGLSAPYKAEWIDLVASKNAKQISPPRSGHTSFQVKDDTFVFGGYAEEPSDTTPPNRHVVNDLWKYDMNTGWIVQATKGHAVNPRLASASAVIQNTPTLFGGWDPQTPGTGGIILDDICQLDLSTLEWKKLDLVLPDGPTSRHVAVSLDENRILIHTHRCSDHVIVFEQTKGQEPSIYKQPTTGEAPSSRGLHAAAALPNSNKFVVFGGAAQDGAMSNEVFVLDTATWQWSSIETTSSEGPVPRASPCVCAIDSNSLVVFGGATTVDGGGLQGCNDLWLLTLDDNAKSGQWQELPLRDGPPARNAATMNRIDPPVEGDEGHWFLLQGGWEPFKETWNDVYLLRVCQET